MEVQFDVQTINVLRKMYLLQEDLAIEYLKPISCAGDQNKLTYAMMYHEMITHAQLLKHLTNTICKNPSDEDSMHLKILLYGVIFKYNEQTFKFIMERLSEIAGQNVATLLVSFLKQDNIIFILKKNSVDLYETEFWNNKIISPFITNHSSILKILNHLESIEKSSSKDKNVKVFKKIENQSKVSTLPEFKTEIIKKDDNESKAKITKQIVSSKPHDASRSLKPMFEIKSKSDNSSTSDKKTTDKVKSNASSLLRIKSNFVRWQESETAWIESLCKGNYDTSAIDLYAKEKREEIEKEQMIQIQKKHLNGLLTHEEMVIARENVLKKNKDKYENFLREKKMWEEKIEVWKAKEYARILSSVSQVRSMKSGVQKARQSVEETNKSIATDLKSYKEIWKSKIVEDKRKELEKKCILIKEIKALHVVIKTINKDKVFDFTETSNIGLFCEMSLAELKERLTLVKANMKRELEVRKNNILRLRQLSKAKERMTKQVVEEFFQEKEYIKGLKNNSTSQRQNKNCSVKSDDTIVALRNKLEERRALRLTLLNSR